MNALGESTVNDDAVAQSALDACDDEWARFSRSQAEYQHRCGVATVRASVALGRLLVLANDDSCGQAETIAWFICSCSSDGCRFNFHDLRTVDAAISDDMLAVLDFLRLGQGPIEALLPSGRRRIVETINAFEMNTSDLDLASESTRDRDERM